MKLRHALKTAGTDADLLDFGALAEIEEAGGFVARTGRNVDGGYAGVQNNIVEFDPVFLLGLLSDLNMVF